MQTLIKRMSAILSYFKKTMICFHENISPAELDVLQDYWDLDDTGIGFKLNTKEIANKHKASFSGSMRSLLGKSSFLPPTPLYEKLKCHNCGTPIPATNRTEYSQLLEIADEYRLPFSCRFNACSKNCGIALESKLEQQRQECRDRINRENKEKNENLTNEYKLLTDQISNYRKTYLSTKFSLSSLSQLDAYFLLIIAAKTQGSMYLGDDLTNFAFTGSNNTDKSLIESLLNREIIINLDQLPFEVYETNKNLKNHPLYKTGLLLQTGFYLTREDSYTDSGWTEALREKVTKRPSPEEIDELSIALNETQVIKLRQLIAYIFKSNKLKLEPSTGLEVLLDRIARKHPPDKLLYTFNYIAERTISGGKDLSQATDIFTASLRNFMEYMRDTPLCQASCPPFKYTIQGVLEG